MADSSFFSSAMDFGYSKTSAETLQVWNRERILGELLAVIQQFRPDVIVTRFALDTPGHGHHQASAILAKESFTALDDQNGDSFRPVRLIHNKPHWLKKDYQDEAGLIAIDTSGYFPLSGTTIAEIAAASRTMHKSQGFGAAPRKGEMLEYFEHVQGARAQKDIFEDIDFSWNRAAGPKLSAELIRQIDRISSEFDWEAPQKSFLPLADLRETVKKVPNDFWREVKLAEIEQLLWAVSAISLESRAVDARVSPGSSTEITLEAVQQESLGNERAEILSVAFLDKPRSLTARLRTGKVESRTFKVEIPKATPFSVPPVVDPDRSSPADFDADVRLKLSGEEFSARVPTYAYSLDPVDGVQRSRLSVVPDYSLDLENSLEVISADAIAMNVSVSARSGSSTGSLSLRLPAGFSATPEAHPVNFSDSETRVTRQFEVRRRQPAEEAPDENLEIAAQFEAGGSVYTGSVIKLDYPHFPRSHYLLPAKAKLLELPTEAGGSIGYVPGSKDEIPDALKKFGFKVSRLGIKELKTEDLGDYDTIVFGIRALNTNDWIADYKSRILDYVEKGGRLVVQYNAVNNFSSLKAEIWPYELELSRDRVTNEHSAVKILRPDHPLLQHPYRITSKDFENWVQERGLYFASTWSSQYTPILEMADPGEESSRGSLLYADYGKGSVIYTGLSFFRQLPQGVPGASKLFINLLSPKVE